MRRLTGALLPALLLAGTGLAGCSQETQQSASDTAHSAAGDADRAADRADRSMANTEASLDKAGDKIAAGADRLGDAARDVVHKADAEMRSDR